MQIASGSLNVVAFARKARKNIQMENINIYQAVTRNLQKDLNENLLFRRLHSITVLTLKKKELSSLFFLPNLFKVAKEYEILKL